MLTLEEFKKAMGENASKYTDEELRQARDEQHELISIIFEQWKIDRKNGKIKQGKIQRGGD
jgi:hypothetical protein